ncbi:hypothetical protein [Bacteroides cellulosilyticus]|uniref:hypothetical protein n=1 Tax=Bacteroides cellulosilyticus TaxID=246787 RepID=UPI0032ECA222
MNKIIYWILAASTVLIGLNSCKENPWDDVTDGGWNHERTILDIKLEGQVGVAQIENTDATTGIINLKVAPDMVNDMSKVHIEKLSLSYQAESSVDQGGIIDFTSSVIPSITVTSKMGETRTYTLSMSPFIETITGIYTIQDFYVYGGTGASYGGTGVVRLSGKGSCWTTGATKPSAEFDNYIVLKLTEVMVDGNTTGECINYGGVDANWWDCIFVAAQNKWNTGDLDLSSFYRRIPKGKSTWVRNYAENTITFIAEDGTVSSSCKLLETGTYTMYSNDSRNLILNVPNQAFEFDVAGKDNWDNMYTDFNMLASSPRKFFIMITKQASDFVLPEDSKTLPE